MFAKIQTPLREPVTKTAATTPHPQVAEALDDGGALVSYGGMSLKPIRLPADMLQVRRRVFCGFKTRSFITLIERFSAHSAVNCCEVRGMVLDPVRRIYPLPVFRFAQKVKPGSCRGEGVRPIQECRGTCINNQVGRPAHEGARHTLSVPSSWAPSSAYCWCSCSLLALVGVLKLASISPRLLPPIPLPRFGMVQDKGIRCDGFWITRWTQDHPREDREAMIGGFCRQRFPLVTRLLGIRRSSCALPCFGLSGWVALSGTATSLKQAIGVTRRIFSSRFGCSAEIAEMVKAGRLRSFLERHRFTRFSRAMREARKPYRSRKASPPPARARLSSFSRKRTAALKMYWAHGLLDARHHYRTVSRVVLNCARVKGVVGRHWFTFQSLDICVRLYYLHGVMVCVFLALGRNSIGYSGPTGYVTMTEHGEGVACKRPLNWAREGLDAPPLTCGTGKPEWNAGSIRSLLRATQTTGPKSFHFEASQCQLNCVVCSVHASVSLKIKQSSHWRRNLIRELSESICHKEWGRCCSFFFSLGWFLCIAVPVEWQPSFATEFVRK